MSYLPTLGMVRALALDPSATEDDFDRCRRRGLLRPDGELSTDGRALVTRLADRRRPGSAARV